jgi:formylglycine-generating enzyme required for sulfatase activity
VANANLVLAGRIAGQAEVRARLPEAQLDELCWALVRRSRDPRADLRERISAGYALGDLGDPRFELRQGPHGEYLLPPLVEIPGGVYPIGDDEPIEWRSERTGESRTFADHMPRHDAAIAGFRIARFHVTNAEWRFFLDAGGYEDDRWWDTRDALGWRRAELANDGAKYVQRYWRKRFRDDATLFDKLVELGRITGEGSVKRWRGWLELGDEAFERVLEEYCKPSRRTAPAYWEDRRYNRMAQPVVGVCWYEARAYCNWLSAQTRLDVRMPTEAEWEASARACEARAYPWGSEFDRLKANTNETHVRRTTPTGVFPQGDTPEGVCDLAGNVATWTSSLYGEWTRDLPEAAYTYPHDPADGRDDVSAPATVSRVTRGGSWMWFGEHSRAVVRQHGRPDSEFRGIGLRLALSL